LAFRCACLPGACFFALPPFSGGRSVISQLAPCCQCLWWFAVYFSILQSHLMLDVARWFRRWTLWSATCPISGSSLSPTTSGLPAFPAVCLLIVHMEISSLPLSPSLVCFQCFCPLCCVLLFRSLSIVQYFFFFFCRARGQSAQGAMLVYPSGSWGNTVWCLALTCLVCRMSPKQVWSQRLAVVGALLFSRCNVVWRSLPQASGSECWSFDSTRCFISAKCGFSISAMFLIHWGHAVCFCVLVTILDTSEHRWKLYS
jgi:hypothetical protein